jgi:hypothetical protein
MKTVLGLPTNVRQSWEGLLRTNTLTHCNYGHKKFYDIEPNTQVFKKLFYEKCMSINATVAVFKTFHFLHNLRMGQ